MRQDGVMEDEGQWAEELKWQKACDRFLKEIKLYTIICQTEQTILTMRDGLLTVLHNSYKVSPFQRKTNFCPYKKRVLVVEF